MLSTSEYRILLIEDDLVYADHLRGLLDIQPTHAFKYDRVSLFSEAIKLIREKHFDSILLDFDLEDMDNMERISELSKEVPDLPIIGLINDTEEEKASDAIEYGLQDRIIKGRNDENVIVSKILFAIRRMEATQLKNSNEIMANELMFDTRTGLPNELLFKDRLEQSLTRADRDNTFVGLVAVQFEHFVSLNDQYGSKTGASILQKSAKILNSMVRQADTVAHVGENKFVVVLDSITSASGATAFGERVVRAFSRKLQIEEHKLKMTANVGIATYPECRGFHELIKASDWAMKRAGDAGGNRYKLYSDNLGEEAIWKYGLENELEKAHDHQQFELHYQPLFGIEESRVVGFEALIRWNHPDEGTMMPGAFIDELEASELILEVGEWVLDEACKQLKLWQIKYPTLMMSINLSARQLQDPYLLERVNSILDKYSLEAQMVELEITERQLVDTEDAISQYNIQSLSDRGICLALDDFGTGYSTEAYFQNFPKGTIHTLKIDRADIKGMMDDAEIAERVESYIEFSHKNGIRVIAEGIEEEAQMKRVQELGVEIMQGYLLSKPVSGSEIEDGMRRNDFILECSKPTETLALISY